MMYMHDKMVGTGGDEVKKKKKKSPLAAKLTEVYAENPYGLYKKGSQFVVKNQQTGHVKGTHASRENAMRQFRLLEGIAHGWKPTGRK